MATNPTPVTQLPLPVPTTQDPSNFDVRADAFLGALPLWGDQLNALGTVTYNNAVDGANSATAALASKNAAAVSETNALASKNAAAVSETNALASKNAADASATAAAVSETNALASKNAADASATAASNSATAAASSSTTAQQYRDEAEVFARTQIVGTSTTSILIGAGQKNLTTQPNKAFSIGQYLVVASQANFNNQFSGLVSSYNATTGALVIEADGVLGSGTHSDWVISLSANPGEVGELIITEVNANTTVVSGVFYILKGDYTLTLPPPASITPGFKFGFGAIIGGTAFGKVDWNGNNVKNKLGGVMTLVNSKNTATVIYSGTTSIGFVEV